MQRAVTMVGKKTLYHVAEEEDVDENGDSDGSEDNEPPEFGVGDIVAVVEAKSTPQQPLILLGKILRMEATTREVLLAHLRPATEDEQGPTFRLVVGRSSWRESFAAIVHPIDVDYSRKTRMYTLKTDPLEIHRVVLGPPDSQ